MENNNKNTEQFPGYPHYPASEDITKSGNNNGVTPLKRENQGSTNNSDHINDREADTLFVTGTDADVTNEDLQILNATEQNMDSTDGLNLQHATLDNVDEDGDPLNEENNPATDFTGESLDVPGSEDDDANENIGEEDEENNYYSLGGDLHEGQEENQGD
jgi:hypothetical protein